MIIDIKKIQKLLDSDITGYKIAQEAGLQESQVGKYRRGQLKVENMTLETGLKFMKFIKGEEMKEELITKLKNYMNIESNNKEFIKNYEVTENIIDLKIDDEVLKNVEVIWATNEDRDYVILQDGTIYGTEEDDIEILF